jgi:hypothetical protein
MMKNKLILLFALGLCAQVQAQVPHLSRKQEIMTLTTSLSDIAHKQPSSTDTAEARKITNKTDLKSRSLSVRWAGICPTV